MTVDLALGAEDNPVAVALAERIRQNLRDSPRIMADFTAIRATVMFVAQDATVAVTLRFDHGRVTLHDGAVGTPAVTFFGDEADLLALRDVPIAPWPRLPLPLSRDPARRGALGRLILKLGRGDFVIYGLLAHPRLVLRLLRVLSRP